MSTTPARPTSPPPQATTRRVSFSPAVTDILTAVNARRRSRSNSSSAAPSHSNYRLALGANGSATPCTTPHRTRKEARDAEATPSSTTTNSSPRKLTGKASAAVLLPPAGSSSLSAPLPAAAAAAALSPTARDSVSGTTTTTIEFSIKDISLDGQMAPPVWRESSTPLRRPSSRHATPSHRTPPSSHLTAHPSAEERRGDTLADSSPSAKPSNPYADVARDQSNLRRRQRVVRTFFDSHEDAVRLYIRLQQLLGYRDVCRAEFEQRLRFTPSEAEREAVVAARAQRLAAQEKEIEKMQAVLATVDVGSSEFASSMNSLYSTRSGTPSDRVAHRDGIVSPHIRPQTGCQHHNDNNSSDRRAPRRWSDTPTTVVSASSKRNPAAATTTAKKNQLTSTDTRRASAEPQRPASTPRHGSPREALEAWRSLHADKAASATGAKREDEGEREEKKNEGEHKYPDSIRGAIPRNSVTASTNSMPHLAGRARSGGVASVLRVTQEEAPPAPRQAAPFGSASSSEAPYRSGMPSADQSSTYASLTRESSSVRSRPGRDGRPWLRSAEAAAAAKSPASLSPLPQQEQQQEATPEQEKKALTRSVAGLVTPPRAGQSSGFTSHNRSPNYRQNTSRALLAAQDSPLARFRQQRGYQDPQQHYRVQPAAHTAATTTTTTATTAPLRQSPSLLGSPKRVPRQWQTPPTVEAAESGKADSNGAREAVVSQPKKENTEESALTSTSKVKREPHAGPGTALLRAGLNGGDGKGPQEESSSNRSSVAPSDSAKEAAVASMEGSSPLAGPTRSAPSQRYGPADSKCDPLAAKGSPSAAELSEAVSKVPLSVIDCHHAGLVSSPSPSLLSSPPQRGSPLRQLKEPPTPQTAADVAAIPSATGSSSARDSSSPDAAHEKRSNSEAERPQSSQLTGTDAVNKGVRDPVNPPHDHDSRESDTAVWDGIAELERRVGGLESRTAELEKNAAKRAVLDAIRLLRERVAVLESRAAVLEGCQDESQLHQLQWRLK